MYLFVYYAVRLLVNLSRDFASVIIFVLPSIVYFIISTLFLNTHRNKEIICLKPRNYLLNCIQFRTIYFKGFYKDMNKKKLNKKKSQKFINTTLRLDNIYCLRLTIPTKEKQLAFLYLSNKGVWNIQNHI